MNMQRFALPNGIYDVKIKLDDLNDTLNANYIHSVLEVYIPNDSASISSVIAVQEYSKTDKIGPSIHSGFNFVPNIYNYFPEQDSMFTFYAELYNVDKSIGEKEPYLLNYYISNFETNVILEKYKLAKRKTALPVDVLFGKFDISNLPSGNFIFTVELIDRNNTKIVKKDYFFQRENKNIQLNPGEVEAINIINTFAELITGQDTLSDVIRAMNPISSSMENEFAESIIKDGNEHMMQQYIFHFWNQRNPLEPSKPFIAYMTEVMKVNNEYGTGVKKGYETDRGRIYLKFGQPNSIMKQYNEPASYPYEIWHFYDIVGQSNVKFVFYNTDLASNDFELLHSNAIGEVSNYQWRLELRKRDKTYRSIDETGSGGNDWGSQYNEYWERPR